MSSTPEPVPAPLPVELWSDLVCPWCYLGEHRLRAAVEAVHAELGEERFVVVLRSFELDPTAGPETMPVPELLAAKTGGSLEDARAMDGRTRALAEAEGLPYTSDRLSGSTFAVHRLQHLARAHGRGPAFFRSLQRAYFAGEVDPFDATALTGAAVAAGLAAAEVQEVLAGDRYAEDVRADEAQARAYGVTGVPFVAVDARFGVPGAQSVEVYTEALRAALQPA
jgi:predicted DsbA family dithiol-disulfide isomerase